MEQVVASCNSLYVQPTENLIIKILVDIARDLTIEEQYFIREKREEISDFIRTVSVKNDPESIKISKEETVSLLNCFPTLVYAKEIPNQYSEKILNPWFLVTTQKGNIKIGWRKRVIVIDWEDSDIKEMAEDLFKNEDTTKYKFYIHAWGYDKAKEYISKLLQ